MMINAWDKFHQQWRDDNHGTNLLPANLIYRFISLWIGHDATLGVNYVNHYKPLNEGSLNLWKFDEKD